MWVDPTTAWAQTSGRETFEGSGGAGLRGLWGPVSGHLSKSGWSVVLSCVRKGPFKRVQGGPYCMRYFSPDHRTLGSNLRAILAWNIPFFFVSLGELMFAILMQFPRFFSQFFYLSSPGLHQFWSESCNLWTFPKLFAREHRVFLLLFSKFATELPNFEGILQHLRVFGFSWPLGSAEIWFLS